MIKQFFNIQNIVTILACVGVFFMATKIESCQNRKELDRLDKVIADKDKEIAKYETRRKTDSTTIKKQGLKIFSLEQDLDICNNNILKYQIVVSDQTKTINKLKSNDNSCCAELKHLEENENIRYFIKKPLSKWFEEVKEKPLYIKK